MELPLNGNDDKIVIALLTSIDATTRNMYELLKLKETADLVEHLKRRPRYVKFNKGLTLRQYKNKQKNMIMLRQLAFNNVLNKRNKTARKMLLPSEFNSDEEEQTYARYKADNIEEEVLTHFKYKGKKYYKSSQNELWEPTANGKLGSWVGIYHPESNTINASAPEPLLEGGGHRKNRTRRH